MVIAFSGHSVIPSDKKIKEIIKEKIRNNIVDVRNVICYLGGYGDFDNICARACRELKEENFNIERIYVTPYISVSEQNKIKGSSFSVPLLFIISQNLAASTFSLIPLTYIHYLPSYNGYR